MDLLEKEVELNSISEKLDSHEIRSSMYGLSCVSPVWEARPGVEGFIVKDQTKIHKVPPATYRHSQLRNQMLYCEELDSLLYHSDGRILSFDVKTSIVSEFWSGGAQAIACGYGYFVYGEEDISILKISTKVCHNCNLTTDVMDVNSLHITKEGDRIFVIATYNGGIFNLIEVIEKEDHDFNLHLGRCVFSNQNYNIISRGDGKNSNLYASGRDGQKSVVILKTSEGFTTPVFSIHTEYDISLSSSSITTKWLPNSSQILTGTESGASILSDIEQQKELWVLPLELTNQPDLGYTSARIIKCGHPYIPLTAIAYSKSIVRLLYLEENLIENLSFVADSNVPINGLEFVRNRLYVMVGSFLYSFGVDNRSHLAAGWPASYRHLSLLQTQAINEISLVLKHYSVPPELIHLILRRILMQWPI